MKSKKALGIQAKVLGILLPCVIIILGIILFLFYSNISELVVRKSEEVLTTETENVVNQVSAWMDRTITALNAERDAIEYFSLDEEDELNYIKHLADQYDSFPAGIYFATTQGKLIHASFVAGSDYNVFEKDWYKEGINSENFAFRAVYLDANTNTYVVGVSGILKNKNGSVRGVAAADIYLDTISEIVKPIQIEETGAVFLIDSSTGTVIGSKDDKLAGSVLEESKEGMYGFIAGQIKKKSEGLHTYTSADGSSTYIDLKLVPNSDWVTVSYVPEAEVMKDLNSLVKTLVMIAVLSMIILTTLIVLLNPPLNCVSGEED